ncbi:unnamed protein product, partial [Mesorhabditis belari]|uniref:Uncharacterized protein n=1 Tax=Mesorhabditis belari TaxID=2138241 RepID=A0AAF3J465_9BILA
MVSTRSLSWTCVLVQLVLSCACLLGSLGVIAAILQSKSIYPERDGTPSIEWWLLSLLCLFMIGASILAMFGLAAKNTQLIVPHIVLLGLCSVFVGWCLYLVFSQADPSNFNWWLSLGALSTAEIFVGISLLLEVKVALTVT